MLASSVLLLSGLAVEPAAAGPIQVAKPAQELVKDRPDRLSAAITAKAQGSRVEVVNERTEFSSTWVNPDGTSTTEQHAGQIRYREGGVLKDVDLTLEPRADGTVAPRGHALGLVLGKGGAGKGAPLATIGDGHGRQVTLGAPTALPEPVLDGTRVTYPNVTPGVDLVVEARRTGFEQDFVLRTRPTGPVSWQLPLATKGLTARSESDGSVSFIDSRGEVVSSLPAATAWDAVVDPRSGDHANTSSVALSVAQKGKGQAVLTVTPDATWLADPSRVFPVTVDPTYATNKTTANFDTFVQEGYSSDQSSSTELRAGTYDGSTVARSFLNFPRAGFSPYKIMSASLYLNNNWSYSCTKKPVNVWAVTGNASTATRWTSQPTIAASNSGTVTESKGYSSSCDDGWIAIPMTALAQSWAASGGTTVTAAIRASESDVYGWKKFASLETATDPYVSFTYDRRPGTASAPTLSPVTTYQAAGDTAAKNYTSDSTPWFASKASDADLDTVKLTFEVHNSTTVGAGSLKASCVTAPVAQNTNASCGVTTALADNTQYYVRVAPFDGYLWSGTATAIAWSAWTTFRLGAATPAAPMVSCPGYANNSWATTLPLTPVSCTITAPPVSATGFNAPGTLYYTIDGAAAVSKKLTAPNTATGIMAATSTPVTVSAAAGSHTVTAYTQTPAGKPSTVSTLTFGYGSTALSQPQVTPRTTTTSTVKIAAAGPPRGTGGLPTATLQWRLAGSAGADPWVTATAAQAPLVPTDNGAAGIAVAGSWNVQQTIRDAMAMNPNVHDRRQALLEMQLCLSYTLTPPGTQCTGTAQPISVQYVPHAFGNGFPTASAGPGQVALWTGEFNTSVTDVSVPGYSGALSLGRGHSTYAGDTDTTTGVFGPGWTASLQGPEEGEAGLQVLDSTHRDGTLAFVDSDGEALVFSRGTRRADASLAGTYSPANEDTRLVGSTLTVAGTGAATTLTLQDIDDVATVFAATATPVTNQPATFRPAQVTAPGDPAVPTAFLPVVGGDARVGRIVAAHPAAVSCPSAAATPMEGDATFKGCRALTLEYSPSSSPIPTGTTIAAYPNRLRSVWLELWDPTAGASGAMTRTEVVRYGYDSSGHLRTVMDPRNNLTTGYTYGGDKIATVTPPGQIPFQLDYTSETTARLARVRRDRPSPETGTATLASYVYDGVPLSGAGVPDLSTTGDDAAPFLAWYQNRAPKRGMAVFGPDHPLVDPASPAVVSAGGVSASDWVHASLSYTDDLGYTVNTASHGAGAWLVSSTDYDALGNVTRQLDATATATVTSLAGAPETALNPGQVDELASLTTYNDGTESFPNASAYPVGSLVLDGYGPSRWALLSNSTTPARVRPHTHISYDEGAPNGGINPETNR